MNRRRILLFLGFIVLAGVVYAFLRRSSEPRYQGHSLSYWYKEYCHPFSGLTTLQGTRRREEALVALRHIGTNALPYLVELAYNTNRDSALRSNVVNFVNGFRRFWLQPPMVGSEQMQKHAVALIFELKPPASALIPLLQTYSRSTNLATSGLALYTLGGVGDGAEEAVPWLTVALTEPRRSTSPDLSLESLERLGPAARSALPALIEFLEALKGTNLVESMFAPVPATSTNNYPRGTSALKNRWLASAAKTLGSIGKDAGPAVPLLQEFFESRTNASTQTEIAFALCRIDPGQTNALAYLVAKLGGGTLGMLQTATYLADLGTNARVAVPVLVDALSHTNSDIRLQAARSLKKIGVPPTVYLPAMKAGLGSTDPMAQLEAAMHVMELDSGDHDAIVFFISCANPQSPARFGAVSFLGNAGPAAKEAIPALRELLKSDDPRLRSEAAEALRKIEAKAPAK